MRRAIIVTVAILIAVLVAGCSSAPPAQPLGSSSLVVLGTSGSGPSASAPVGLPIGDPAADEHIPQSEGVLVRTAGGVTGVSESRAIVIARTAGISQGASSVSAVHVTLGSDVSRPEVPKTSATSVSAWMVTFHRVKLPDGGSTNGQIGSSTVLLDSDSGKVIRVVNYVPVMP
jgi:hypothetical protein